MPNEGTEVSAPQKDVYPTFKVGHKIQVQIQSGWFPYIDRNPQTFVPDIFEARATDFQSQTHRLHHSPGSSSFVQVTLLGD